MLTNPSVWGNKRVSSWLPLSYECSFKKDLSLRILVKFCGSRRLVVSISFTRLRKSRARRKIFCLTVSLPFTTTTFAKSDIRANQSDIMAHGVLSSSFTKLLHSLYKPGNFVCPTRFIYYMIYVSPG